MMLIHWLIRISWRGEWPEHHHWRFWCGYEQKHSLCRTYSGYKQSLWAVLSHGRQSTNFLPCKFNNSGSWNNDGEVADLTRKILGTNKGSVCIMYFSIYHQSNGQFVAMPYLKQWFYMPEWRHHEMRNMHHWSLLRTTFALSTTHV
jgi:hypothetical protein